MTPEEEIELLKQKIACLEKEIELLDLKLKCNKQYPYYIPYPIREPCPDPRPPITIWTRGMLI